MARPTVLPGLEEAALPRIELEDGPHSPDHGADLSPVDLLHVRDHQFVKRGKGGRSAPGCADCGAGKQRMIHIGAPPSLNAHGSAANKFQYQAAKKAWQERLTELLKASGLPRGLSYVLAEGQVCFPDRQRRDQGNFRFLLEKALGDALVDGGDGEPWLEDDSWDFFEFGRLRREYMKGASWTSLTLYPRG